MTFYPVIKKLYHMQKGKMNETRAHHVKWNKPGS